MEITTQNACLTQEYGLDKGYEMIAAAGFTGIDWGLDSGAWDGSALRRGVMPTDCLYARPLEELIAHFTPEIEAVKRHGLHFVQAHAPFPAYIHLLPDFTDFCIEIYKNILRLCQYAGCPQLVIHGISRHSYDPLTGEEFRLLNMRMYSSLISVAKETGVMILMENLFMSEGGRPMSGTCSSPHEAVRYIDELNALAGQECFGLCLDTGHLNLLSIPMRPYIDIVGHRIKALHIHDNSGYGDDHLAPYTGSINWNDFCEGLRHVGYKGNLNFETYAQLLKSRIDEPLVMPYLHLIHACGEVFRSKIEG